MGIIYMSNIQELKLEDEGSVSQTSEIRFNTYLLTPYSTVTMLPLHIQNTTFDNHKTQPQYMF